MRNPLVHLWSLALITMVAPPAARAGFVALDPAATYLHTNDDPAPDATAYSLASLSLSPGQTITLTEVGTYSRGPTYQNIYTDLNVVFSSTNVLLATSVEDRVPGAIGVGVNPIVTPPTYNGNEPTDIPTDFYISLFGSPMGSSVTLAIPTGAAYLFFSTDDVYFSDNTAPNNSFGVDISIVPEPGSLILGFMGAIGSIAFISKRTRRMRLRV
jgi:hypothetical protein